MTYNELLDYIDQYIYDNDSRDITPTIDNDVRKKVAAWVRQEIGNLDSLTTTDKSNVVAALNELETLLGDNTTDISNIQSSLTSLNSSITYLLNEINSLDSRVGANEGNIATNATAISNNNLRDDGQDSRMDGIDNRITPIESDVNSLKAQYSEYTINAEENIINGNNIINSKSILLNSDSGGSGSPVNVGSITSANSLDGAELTIFINEGDDGARFVNGSNYVVNSSPVNLVLGGSNENSNITFKLIDGVWIEISRTIF